MCFKVHHVLYFQTMRLGWNLKIGFIGLIHKKLLTIGSASLQQQQSGKVFNLVSTDVLQFDKFYTAVHFGW